MIRSLQDSVDSRLVRSHRHHRYVFEEKKGKLAAKEPLGARLQEIGPRFTLRLRSLQVRAASKPIDC